MNFIFNAIEKVEEKLGHSPHPAIVGLPLGAWTVTALTDALSFLRRRQAFDDTARISMGIGLLGAAGAVLTGIHDYSYIPRERATHKIATNHALINSAAATLFVTSYVMRQRHQAEEGARASFLARAASLCGWGLSLYAAKLGGVLVEEHGEAVKPVIRWQAEEEKRAASQKAVSAPSEKSKPVASSDESLGTGEKLASSAS